MGNNSTTNNKNTLDTTIDTTNTANTSTDDVITNTQKIGGTVMSRLFVSCSDDPKSSVHRAWGVSLLFLVLYFIVSIIEMLNLEQHGGSRALVIATIWTGLLHLMLAILGTFILKRFPTSFALGFFIGVILVVANQNLILFGIFHGYVFGNLQTHHIFSSLCFTLSIILLFFTALLVHFRQDLVVAPIDVSSQTIMTTTSAKRQQQQQQQLPTTQEQQKYDKQVDESGLSDGSNYVRA
mmetsp:Transcript_38443/g.43890  ORF Transcript_38443/g.43890 Transcript_38443/m.43890 type:complete len:238 (+) Transcript_38443:545-1258(+)